MTGHGRRVARAGADRRSLAEYAGALLGLFGVVVLWAGVLFSLAHERQKAVEGARQDMSNLARAFEETVVRSLKSVDQSLLYVREAYLKDPTGFDLSAWARSTESLSDVVFQFSRIDRDGLLATSNFAATGNRIDLSDREHFRVQLDPAQDRMFISRPLIGRASKKWSLNLTRKLLAASGAFDGVIVVSLDPHYLSRFYNSVDLGHSGLVALAGTDGIVRALAAGGADVPPGGPVPGVGGQTRGIGASLAGGAEMAALARAGAGTLEQTSAIDGVTRIEAYRAVRGYPLFVVVGIAKDDVLAIHRDNVRIYLLVALLLSVALIGASVLIIARQTRLARARAALHDSQLAFADKSQMLETTLEAMSQGILMIDAAGRAKVCNKRAAALLGLPEAMMQGQPTLVTIREAIRDAAGDGRDETSALLPSPDHATTLAHETVTEHRLPNGVLLEMRTRPLPEGGLVQTYTDITARAAAEEMLGVAAARDHLTGLANRNGFAQKIEAALAAARRNAREVTVMCLDLDRFKAVNDTLGHDGGDRLLRQVADRLRDTLRTTDVIARMGGDEFAIVLAGHNPAGAGHVAQMLLTALQTPFQIGGEEANIGASIGIATYPMDGATSEQLLRNADAALYQAKACGRNAWRAFNSEEGERGRYRAALEQDLARAMEKRQFSLAFQPICNALSGEAVSFEALLRWSHPDRGLVPPGEFLPIAEDSGLIIPLGRWVLETACTEAATWARPLRISVNISPSWFHSHDLARLIHDVLERTGLDPKRLELEMTEAALIDPNHDIAQTMTDLRAMGIRLVLDDFGAGEASLDYLRRFPFDQVKIDRSFMRALSSDRQARTLVESILAAAQSRGIEVVAEGVETQEQLTMLRHMRCDWVQGFLMGHPLDGTAARTRLRRVVGG